MFSTTFAEAGTGKLPSFPLTTSMRLAMGAPVDGGAVETTPWLGVSVLVLAELAVGVPAEHAATARLAAQVASASAAERYLFIAVLHSVPKSQVLTLDARPAGQGRFGASPASLRHERDRGHVLGPEPLLRRAIRFAAAVPPRPVQIIYLDAC